jgi:solute carrier family 25, member 39/40
MSTRWDQHAQADEVATQFDRKGHSGQGHDRIHSDNLIPGVSSTIGISGDLGSDRDDVEIDINAGQKMISAMSGSLLTSLLGRS